jgi:hypothetical protein
LKTERYHVLFDQNFTVHLHHTWPGMSCESTILLIAEQRKAWVERVKKAIPEGVPRRQPRPARAVQAGGVSARTEH